MYALYTDDSILAQPDKEQIIQVYNRLERSSQAPHYRRNDFEDILVVHIEQKKDGSIYLTQSHLYEQILKDLQLDNDNVST